MPPHGVVDEPHAEGGVGMEEAALPEQGPCKWEHVEVPFPFPEAIDLVTESDSSESDSGESCLASGTSDDEEPGAKRPRLQHADRQRREATWYAHCKSGLLHFCWSDPADGKAAQRMTACGRMVTANYAIMDDSTAGNLICVICQKRQD